MELSLKLSRFGIPRIWIATWMVAAACSGRIGTSRIELAPAVVVAPSHSDTVQVYQRALQTLYEATSEVPGVIVILDSATTGVERACAIQPCKLSPAVDSHVESSALKNYGIALTLRGPLQRDLQRNIRIEFISVAELAKFPAVGASRPNDAERHGQSADPFWDEFRRRFPGAWGLTSVTRIAFSDDADQALLQIRHGCGQRCVRMESMFLEQRGGTWFVEGRFPEESEDWIGQGALRYVGPDSRARAAYFRDLDAAAMAAADSVRKDNSPRRIRGTIINRAFGTPIAGAQIFVRSPKTEPEPWARVVADSLGRFEVKDAPIGTIMLELQCPGPSHQMGKTLDAPGFYLFAAMDTTLTMGPPDLRPCWSRERISRLTLGELDSGENRTSVFPSDMVADVYSAVLRKMFGLTSRSREIVLSSRTYERCSKHEACSTLRLPQLTRAGTLDSTASVEFRLRSQETVPISSRFATKHGLQLFLDAERTYLEEEGNWLRNKGAPYEDGRGFWKALSLSHGGAAEIISFTRPGFNSTKTQALVEIKRERPEGQAKNTILLKRSATGWKVAREHLENETLSGKLTPAPGRLAGDRCVPTKPGSPPDRKQLQQIRGDYEFEMISSVGGGPNVRWRMRFFTDTSSWAQPKKEWTEAVREKFDSLRRLALPVFIVLDPRTGDRMKSVEAGTYVVSGKNYIGNAGHTFQLDGFGYNFEISGISESAIFGSWEHYSFGVRIDSSGNPVPEPSGHFCARKVSPIP